MVKELLQNGEYEFTTSEYCSIGFAIMCLIDEAQTRHEISQEVITQEYQKGEYFEGIISPVYFVVHFEAVRIDGRLFQVNYAEDFKSIYFREVK